jgi:putative ABC transport system permease protein
MSARASLVYSVGDVYYELYRYPIQFSLLEEESDQQIAQAEQVANVGTVEVWQQVDGFVRPAGQPRGVQDEYPQVVGVPVPSDSYAPHILEGRWLEPDDTYAVVMHEQLALNVGVKVGDWVTISIPDDTNSELWRSEQDWQVVGVLFDPSNTSMLMAPRAALASEIGGAGKGNKVQIGTPLAEEPQVADLAVSLRRFFDYRSIDLAASDTDTLGQRSAKFLRNVNTLTTLLVAMAVIVGTVGGIALTGVLSLGVLERRKEIGVLRAIGASPRTILSQFVAEGLMMGWLSWLIALALSYPAGYALATVLGSQLQLSVLFQYSSLGVWLWLALATLIGVVASWSPAQGAIKMSVQESLAYE